MNARPGAAASNPLREGLEDERGTLPTTLVIFGASGDLTQRKLVPAIYNLAVDGLLHPETSVIGVARKDWNDDSFRAHLRKAVEEHSRRQPVDEEVWTQLAGDLCYVAGEFGDTATHRNLAEELQRLDAARGGPTAHIFYLAAPPSTYEMIARGLGEAGLAGGAEGKAPVRIVVEKPFGRDLPSAEALNRALHAVFDESQIFRIDHFLGKETVQNLLIFRLDNGIFEPLWSRHQVDHVQITVAETLGVGSRAGFYEEAGVSRDMLQNHLLQLLTLVAMEPPVRFDARSIRDEKVKVLEALRVPSPDEVRSRVVRGQYRRGMVEGNEAAGYREEPGVAQDSATETYLAAKLFLDNWRWAGIPFYVRSGKRLAKHSTEIAIVFKIPPFEIIPDRDRSAPRPNVLRFRIQPEEGISLSFESKVPGQALDVEEVRMDMRYATSFGRESPEAYEHLLLDAIQGDSTLFAREDEVELSWRVVDAIRAGWTDETPDALHPYDAGTWGPEAADRLLAADGRRWLRP
jgi:glucose-6-phosphate 1-dehydrogenase